MNLRVQEGRPIVDGVYVNGQGPFRFLIDTGSNVNFIETNLARKIGMNATFRTELASASGKTVVEGSTGNDVTLDSVKASGQELLFSNLDAIHSLSSDVQGVLGQWFLSQFDYVIDLKRKTLEFGKQNVLGTRVSFKLMNGRILIPTSLGDLVLDSGTARLVLFGVESGAVHGVRSEWQTVAGSQQVGMVSNSVLAIEGRTVWRGEAIAIPNRSDPGVAGLLPLGLFKMVYVCNSEGYTILE